MPSMGEKIIELKLRFAPNRDAGEAAGVVAGEVLEHGSAAVTRLCDGGDQRLAEHRDVGWNDHAR